MTVAELTKRVEALEAALAELRAKQEPAPALQRAWWREDAGRFANDPVFDEIVRLGREYREGQRPNRNEPR
jgi:hypothetical protein